MQTVLSAERAKRTTRRLRAMAREQPGRRPEADRGGKGRGVAT
jgi:hypothetical protein